MQAVKRNDYCCVLGVFELSETDVLLRKFCKLAQELCMTTELALLTCTSLQDLDGQMLAGFIHFKGITTYWDHFIPRMLELKAK